MNIEDLTKPMIEILEEEVNELIKHYKWEWDEDDMCYYADNGLDICDTVYFDTDGYLCHPKLLATYVEEYLNKNNEGDKYV